MKGGDLIDGEGNARQLEGIEMRASNGYVYVIDGVLFPADLVTMVENINAPGGSFVAVFDIFLAGVERAGLQDALSGVNGPYTVSGRDKNDPELVFTPEVRDWSPGLAIGEAAL